MRKTDAERTLEVAVDAATIAHRQAKEATAAKDRAERLVPDPHKEMLQALAGEEERAHRASRPKSRRWRGLGKLDDKIDQHPQTGGSAAGAPAGGGARAGSARG